MKTVTWPTAKNSWTFCTDAGQRRLHLAVIRPCALSRVSLFSSSVRGGGGGAVGGNSGHCWSRMASMNEAICTSVGFILSRKELTFLEGNTAQQEVTRRQGESRKTKKICKWWIQLTFSGWAWLVSKWHQRCLWGWSFLLRQSIRLISESHIQTAHVENRAFPPAWQLVSVYFNTRRAAFMVCLEWSARWLINHGEGHLFPAKAARVSYQRFHGRVAKCSVN